MQIHVGYTRGVDGRLFTVSASPNGTGRHTRSVERIPAGDAAEAETPPTRRPTT